MPLKRIVSENKDFHIDDKTLGECLDFIEGNLSSVSANKKSVIRTLLMAEEVLPQVISNSTDGHINIQVKKFFGDTKIIIRSEGDEFDLFSGLDEGFDSDTSDSTQQAISALLLKAQEDKIRYYYERGKNTVQIVMGTPHSHTLLVTFIALLLGLALGMLMRFALPESISLGVESYVLSPLKTIFMNALRIIIAPVVFFSIVTCFSQFKNISEFGKIGAKVMLSYMTTTIIAITMSMGLFYLLKPGEFGFALSMVSEADLSQYQSDFQFSLKDTLINIVPSNFVKPFVEADTLQLIFLAVLCGIAVSRLGESVSIIKEFFNQCNSLFLSISTLITRFMPVAVLCSVAMMVKNLSSSTLVDVLKFICVEYLALFLMMTVYGLMILVIGRLNPLTFFKKDREGILTSYSLSSSSASIPTNLRVCTEKLGISPKLANFSIPLGATVNMDGMCTFLVLGSLFLARGYGIEVPPSALLSMGITVALLSLGAPGVPGAGIICATVVLQTIGVPTEAIGIVLGIFPFIDMGETASNTTGDVSVSLVVAKSEGLLDEDVYNS